MYEEIRDMLQKNSIGSCLTSWELQAVTLRNAPPPSSIKTKWLPATSDLIKRKYEWALNTFVFGNSFIGNDYFLLRYSAAQLNQYLQVVENENLSTKQYDTCRLEIEALFYQFLSWIYNIKEKLEIFLCWDSKKNCLRDTVLTAVGEDAIIKIFNDLYTVIVEYCNARNACTHNTYALDYLVEKQAFRVSCFAFTLSTHQISQEQKERAKLSFTFPATVKQNNALVSAIHKALSDILNMLSDLDNVQLRRLQDKFIQMKDGKQVFEISS